MCRWDTFLMQTHRHTKTLRLIGVTCLLRLLMHLTGGVGVIMIVLL